MDCASAIEYSMSPFLYVLRSSMYQNLHRSFHLMLAWAPPTYLCNWLLSSRRSLRNRREEGRVSGRSHSFLDLRRVDVDTRGRFCRFFARPPLLPAPRALSRVNREQNYVRCILLSFAARVDRTRGRRPTTRRALEAPKRPII
jgi:hypothetical protein